MSDTFHLNQPPGEPLRINAVVTGTQPLYYQWRLNGANLSDGTRIRGAHSGELIIDPAQYSDTGDFSLVVSNAYSSVTGLIARVSVTPVIAWGDNSARQLDVPIGASNVVDVSAGDDHSLALRVDGTVIAWGDNLHGQIDIPSSASNVVSVAAGGTHSVALLANAQILAWGDNSYGQINMPPSATNVVAIAAGGSHNLALLFDSTVVAWGSNSSGQTNVPSAATNVIAIAAGGDCSLALRADGTVVTWGKRSAVPSLATNIVSIAAGDNNALALRADGALFAWGGNYYGQSSVPTSVTNVEAMAAGGDHTIVLLADGTVNGWGWNYFCQTLVPSQATNVVAISAGGVHSLALIGTGAPRISLQPRSSSARAGRPVVLITSSTGNRPLNWQWFHNGILIPGAVKPFLMLTSVQRADAGSYTVTVTNPLGETNSQAANLAVQPEPFFAATTTVQTVFVHMPVSFSSAIYGEQPMTYRWQFNGTNLVEGSRVTGTTSPQLTLKETELSDTGDYSLILSNAFGSTTGLVAHLSVSQISVWGYDGSGQTNVSPSATNVTAIAAGGFHSMALRADGSVIAWGSNVFGLTNVPPSVTNVVAIVARGYHSMALRADGTVVAWGDNSYGLTNVPASVTNVIAIADGNNHSLALRADGSVVAWGYGSGQTNMPPWATNVVAITAGNSHSLALRADGTVIAWGYNGSGQTNVPPWATNVVAITAGNSHSMALRADGTVIAWGYNYYGQTNVPPSATNVMKIAAGNSHSMAQRADGTVVAWGYNYYGQTNVPPSATNVTAIAAGDYHSMALVSDKGQVSAFQPIERSATLGESALLTAGSLGRARASFQWQFNGLDLPGATNAALCVGFVNWTNAGIYRVIISNVLGTTVGPPIILTVLRSPLTFDTVGDFAASYAGTFRARLLGASGVGPIVIYASTNLLDWLPVHTNSPVIGPVEFNDLSAKEIPARFYRATE